MSIQIDRKVYTPRDRLLPDRNIYIIKLNAIVPNDSYLITASMPSQLPDISNKVNSIINDIKKNWSDSDKLYNFIKSSIRRLEDTRGKVKNLFPKINNKYFIPGSTLKGAIRSRIEYKLAPKNNKSVSCYIVEDNFYPEYAINHIKFWGNDIVIPRSTCNIKYDNKVCIICDMFGSPSLSSLVNFSDAYMQNGSVERLRDLNNYEAAKPGSKFDLSIVCFNFDYIRLGLLFLGLELYSKSPIIIGMFKYRYNKKLGRLYKNKYSLGLLKFELVEINDYKGNKFDTDKIINDCKEKLIADENINKCIDWDKGVITD